MGESIKIRYLAEQMIRLSGAKVEEIGIKYVGLRPGEKLYEELFYSSEELMKTDHQKIMQAQSTKMNWETLQDVLTQLERLSEQDDQAEMKRLLLKLVPESQARDRSLRLVQR